MLRWLPLMMNPSRFLLMSRFKGEKSLKDKIRLINSIINELALLKAFEEKGS